MTHAPASPAPELESVLMIADVARAIDDFRTLPETLDRICERVRGLCGYQVAALLLPDPRADALVFAGSAGMRDEYRARVNREHPLRIENTGPLGPGPTVTAYQTGEPVTITDLELDHSFVVWRNAARAEGYRSLACIPVIVRARVIGVLNCYGGEPHQHSSGELELLKLVARMAGVAIETARAAEGQRDAAEELRRLSQRLQQQNAELARLTAIQSQLAQTLAEADVTAVERTAATLAEATGRAVLVWGRGGHPLTYAGSPQHREAMALVAARSSIERSLRDRPLVDADGCTCLRIGTADAALGVLVLHPAVHDEHDVALLAGRHAAAVMAGELQSERAERVLESYALPAMLLALVHGLPGAAQRAEASSLLRLEDADDVRLAVLRCTTADGAHRAGRRLASLREAGWPAVAATADDRDALVLVRDADPARIARAAEATRDRHGEVACIGISAPLRDLEDLPGARRQGLVAAEANREMATAGTLFEDLRGLGDVAQRLPPAVAQELVEGTLGPLRAYDDAHGTQLVATLRAYVDQGGKPRETAAALHIHPNTLQQRLRRAADLGGYDVRNLRDLGRIVLALEWERLLAAGAVEDVSPADGVAGGSPRSRATANGAR